MERKLIELDEFLGPQLSQKIPNFLKGWLKRVLHVQDLNDFISTTDSPSGLAFFQAAMDELDITFTIRGEENLDASKRLLFAGNHPLGGPEGLIMGSILGKHFGDNFRVPVNQLMAQFHPIKEFFVPISIFGRQTRLAASNLTDMFASDYQVMIYPAGACAKRIKGRIVEEPWKKTFVTQARRYQRDVIPMHLSGHNSNRFFFLSRLSKFLGLKFNLGMIFLVDELFRKRHGHFVITFGKAIPWQTFDQTKTDQQWADWVKAQVAMLQEGNNCEPNM